MRYFEYDNYLTDAQKSRNRELTVNLHFNSVGVAVGERPDLLERGKELGFDIGTKFKSGLTKGNITITSMEHYYLPDTDELWIDGSLVYFDGNWAQLVTNNKNK